MNHDESHLKERANPTTTLLVVVAAALLTFGLSFLPLAGLITYPLRLFSTFIHETGHALAALLTFGDVHHLAVFPNGSGVTYTSGGWRFAISSAGYLGTTLFGAWMLLSARKESSARWALGITGAEVVLMTALYAGRGALLPSLLGAAATIGFGAMATNTRYGGISRGLFGMAALGALGATAAFLWFGGGLLTWVLGLGSGALLLAAARYTGGDVSKLAAAFLGIQVSLDALHDVMHLVGLSTFSPAHTDAVNMAKHYALPPVVWALGWTGISIVVVCCAVGFLLWEASTQNRKK